MSSDKSNYLIEALEPRILLSAGGFLRHDTIFTNQPINPINEVEEYECGHQTEVLEQGNDYNPEAQLDDLFDGLKDAGYLEPGDQTNALLDNPSGTSEVPAGTSFDSISDDEMEVPVESRDHSYISESSHYVPLENSMEDKNLPADGSTADTFAVQSTTTGRLVTTLNAANPPPSSDAGSVQVIFIDPGVENYKDLINANKDWAEVIVLDGNRDRIQQIVDILADREDIAAINFISQDPTGQLIVDSSVLDLADGGDSFLLNSLPGRLKDRQFIFIADSGNNDYTLRVSPEDLSLLELFDNHLGQVVQSQKVAEISKVVIFGSNTGDDTLTVDFSTPFWLPEGLEYEGGDAWFDTLVFVANGAIDASYTAIGKDAGTIEFTSGTYATTISFAGLEPVVYNNAAGTFTFTPAGPGIHDIVLLTPTLPLPLPPSIPLPPIIPTGMLVISGASFLASPPTGDGSAFEHVVVNAQNVIINLGNGRDKVTISGVINIGSTNLTINADIIEMISGSSITTSGNITFNAQSALNLNTTNVEDALNEFLFNIGTGNFNIESLIEDFMVDDADANVYLNGANLAANNITLTATSTITGDIGNILAGNLDASLSINESEFNAAIASVFSIINVDSLAEVIINGGSILANGNVNISAQSSVQVSATAQADPSDTEADVDAALAISVVNSSAFTKITGSADSYGTVTLSIGGSLAMISTNTMGVTTKADGTPGGDTHSSGGTVAFSKVTTTTSSLIEGDVSLGDTALGNAMPTQITLESHAATNVDTDAIASATGAAGNSTGSHDLMKKAGAGTANGDIKVAGALVINEVVSDTLARANSTDTINTSGEMRIATTADTDSDANADASTVGSNGTATGVGVGVAITHGRIDNHASINGRVSANSITISALMNTTDPVDGINRIASHSTSGTGAADVGVAGALAVNILDADTAALVKGEADLDLAGNLTLNAAHTVNSIVEAHTKSDSKDAEAGIGASVSLNIADIVTRAEVADNADMAGTANLSLISTTTPTVATLAEAGAAGSDATVGGAVSTTNANFYTLSRVGTFSGTTTLSGVLSVQAAQENGSVTTTADGTVTEASSVAAGATLALTYGCDSAKAITKRCISTAGSSISTISAKAAGNRMSIAKASAQGAEPKEEEHTATCQVERQGEHVTTRTETVTSTEKVEHAISLVHNKVHFQTGESFIENGSEWSPSQGMVQVNGESDFNDLYNELKAQIKTQAAAMGITDYSKMSFTADINPGISLVSQSPGHENYDNGKGEFNLDANRLNSVKEMLESKLREDFPELNLALSPGETIIGVHSEPGSAGALDEQNVTVNNIKVVANRVKEQTTIIEEREPYTYTETETTTTIETSEGAVGIAAAIGLTISDVTAEAGVLEDLSSVGAITIHSTANGDSIAKADASATGPLSVGVGAAVSVNLAKLNNRAYILGSKSVKSSGLTITADMASRSGETTPVHTAQAESISGASGETAGVAGSFALNKVIHDTEACIGAKATADGGSLTLTAVNSVSNNCHAKAKSDTPGAAAGVGASVALNIVDVDTRAEMEDGVILINSNNLDLSATTTPTVDTSTEAGAAGGKVNVGGAVATTIADFDTIARIGTVSGSTNVSGTISLRAAQENSTVTTRADGTITDASSVGIGATIALTFGTDTVKASLERQISSTAVGASTISAKNVAKREAIAKASAKGAETSSDASNDEANEQTGKERAQSKSEAGGTGSRSGDTPDASTSDGAVGIAAAIAVTLTNIKAEAVVAEDCTFGGSLTIHSQVNGDSLATSDSSASKTDLGVGVAVAINLADITNRAYIVSTATIEADGFSLIADMADRSGETTGEYTLAADAKSGAGAESVGVAGSVAINITTTRTEAIAKAGAPITISDGPDSESSGGPVVIKAISKSKSRSSALPTTTGGTSGSDVGIGASFALNKIKNSVQAETENGRALNGNSSSLTFETLGFHQTETRTDAGTAGGVAVSPSVAITITDNDTHTHVGSGGTLTITGPINVANEHVTTAITEAKATAAGSDVGVGASVAPAILNETSSAKVSGNLVSLGTGASTVKSKSDMSSVTLAQASAKGNSPGGKKADDEANFQLSSNPNTNDQGNPGTAQQQATSANNNANSNSSTGSSSVGIAAAVAITVFNGDNEVRIQDSAVISVAGSITMRAEAEFDADTKAVGTAVTLSDSNNIGAAVGLNVVDVNNITYINSGSIIDGKGISIEAVTLDDETNEFEVWGVAAGGGSGSVGVAGSVAINVIDKIAFESSASVGSVLDSTDYLMVTSENDFGMQTLAAGAGFSDGVAVGAAIAITILNSTTRSSMAGTADANGPITIKSGTFMNPMTAQILKVNDRSLNINVSSLAVAGGASSGSVGIAGAVVVNVLDFTVIAGIEDNALVNQTRPGTTITIEADNTTNITSCAGSFGLTSGSCGIGAGLDLNLLTKNTNAYIGSGAKVKTGGTITIKAGTYENILSISANAGIGSSAGIAGSASILIVTTNTFAFLEEKASGIPTTVNAGSDVAISAEGNFSAKMIAGSVGVASSAGIGAANTTLVHNDTVKAFIGKRSIVISAGTSGLSVSAISTEDVVTISAAGTAAGSVAISGTAAVTILNERTEAYVSQGASLTADNDIAAGMPSLHLLARDNTTVVSVAGSLAAAGSVGVGVGADVGVFDKSTIAYIDSDATAYAEGNIIIEALSSEEITSVAAGVSVGGSVGVTLDASVHDLTIKTRAFIGDDPHDNIASAGPGNVHANGTVEVSANSENEVDKVVGVLAVGTVGVGAAGGVTIIDKTTEAFIGEGAMVTGDGNSTGITINTGAFQLGDDPSAAKYDPHNAGGEGIEATNSDVENDNAEQLSDEGEVNVPVLQAMDADQDGGDSNDVNDGSLSGQRTAIREPKPDFRGVAVTSSNKDDIEVFTISFAGGVVAVAISAGVNVVNANVYAYIGNNAKVNENLTSANDAQSVHVAAGNDFYHLAVAGTLSVGEAAISPAVDVTVLGVTLKAYIAPGANVKARDDILVEVHGSQDILMICFGIAAGVVGIGGAVTVFTINNTTHAFIASAMVSAGGDIVVLAKDDTDIDVVSGALAAGFVGVGASVGVISINKDTKAFIANDAVVDARGAGTGIDRIIDGTITGDGDGFGTATIHGVIVQAQSSEEIFHLALAAGIGFVGVSGAVTVTLIDSDTAAFIGSNALINQVEADTSGDTAQSVTVNATNVVRVKTFAIGAAGGFVGVAGAVDVGTIKNDITATIKSGAKVKAKNDVVVNSLGIKDLKGFTFSGSGGFVAQCGAVSVWSIGSPIEKSYSDNDGNSANSVANSENKTADADAAGQAENSHGEVSNQLNGFSTDSGNSNNSSANRVGTATHGASSKISSSAPSQSAILA